MRRLHAFVRPLVIASCLAACAASAETGDARLVQAVKARDADAVRALLEGAVDVDATQPDGATALHWAAHWNDTDIAARLLAKGARVDVRNDYGVTPLMLACGNASLPMIDRLLKAGANPNVALPSGETPLMTAARVGNVDVVKTLAAAGARLDATERLRGQNALMWAASEGHASAVRTLIELGADVRQPSTAGYTPLLLAARRGSLPTVAAIVEAGGGVDHAAADGGTALLIATVHGHLDIVTYLLEHGADPNADSAGYTPLHWASGSWETDLRFGPDGARGSTWNALVGLKGARKLEMMTVLLAHGADANTRTRRNVPRYGFSASNDNANLYERLVGATPFLAAARAADADAMRLLVARGADPRLATADNHTPLMEAVGVSRVQEEVIVTAQARLDAVSLALALGADVNAASDAGDTALHVAAFEGADDIVRVLVASGARLDARNKDYDTPWMIAAGMGARRGGVNALHRTTADLLLSLGAAAETKAEEKIRYSDLLNEPWLGPDDPRLPPDDPRRKKPRPR